MQVVKTVLILLQPAILTDEVNMFSHTPLIVIDLRSKYTSTIAEIPVATLEDPIKTP
jgi:hypothetical protein